MGVMGWMGVMGVMGVMGIMGWMGVVGEEAERDVHPDFFLTIQEVMSEGNCRAWG
jgi:hypothetical protein